MTMNASHTSPKKKSSREKNEKKRLHSDAAFSNLSLKQEDTKRIKFEEKPSIKAKCLTFPPKYELQLRIHVSEPDSHVDPVVVSFPAGLPLSLNHNVDKNNINDEIHKNAPPVFKWAKTRETVSRGRILRGFDETCSYTASNEGRSYDGRVSKFYVGVYHKPTQTISLIPSSERGTIFAMNQSVTSYSDTKRIEMAGLSLSQRRRVVFESFGSSKKKKVLKSQDANVVEMRSVIGAGEGMMKALRLQMESDRIVSESNKKVMEDMKIGSHSKLTAIEKAFQEARRGFLPSFDENAEHPFQVYDSQEVAGEDAWAQISRVVDACIHKDDWKDSFQKHPWPKSTAALLDLVANPQKKSSKYQLKTILFVNHLLRFHNKASKKFIEGNLEEVAAIFGLPKPISDRFVELFSTPSNDRGNAGYAISKQHKDKRVLFTLVMYLLAHGKDMKCGSIDQLCKDMRVELKDAILLYREAGCKCVKNKSGMTSVSLTVPLVFPPPNRSKKA